MCYSANTLSLRCASSAPGGRSMEVQGFPRLHRVSRRLALLLLSREPLVCSASSRELLPTRRLSSCSAKSQSSISAAVTAGRELCKPARSGASSPIWYLTDSHRCLVGQRIERRPTCEEVRTTNRDRSSCTGHFRALGY